MTRVLLILFLLLAFSGCGKQDEAWRREYLEAGARWAKAYAGPNALIAYEETLRFTEYVKRMERDGRPFERIPDVLIWNYARLGLLAEHLERKEEAKRYFAIAARYAQKTYPDEPQSKRSEAGFRSALEQMDSPDTHLWIKEPNQPSEPTAASGRGSL
jgi:hypothetical protein